MNVTRALSFGYLAFFIACPAVCLAQASTEATKPRFDVVSIRPVPRESATTGPLHKSCKYLYDRVVCQSSRLELIEEAYQLKKYEIFGPQQLSKDEVFAVQAIEPPGTTKDISRLMLQQVLSDRFQLKFHFETRDIHTYALLAGKHGAKVELAADPDRRGRDSIAISSTSGKEMRASTLVERGRFYTAAMSLGFFASNYLGDAVDLPVIDMTGLTGEYKIDLHWTPTEGPGINYPLRDPGFLDAVKEQLGLQLVKRVGPYKTLVIDHIEPSPSEN